ncbi:hypothetical protein ALP64_200564 [Pseudomonas syringae pv. actinidiae]|nr:hypothetical protein ALP64_200564 [Pseudomonas syringae pv. actinidiae]
MVAQNLDCTRVFTLSDHVAHLVIQQKVIFSMLHTNREMLTTFFYAVLPFSTSGGTIHLISSLLGFIKHLFITSRTYYCHDYSPC